MTVTAGQRTSASAVQDAYPLSRLQAGMIYHAELTGDPSLYHDIYSLRVHGPWVEDAFRAALDAVVAAHDTLRTSFELTRFSEPVQLVHRRAEPPVSIVDLRARDSSTVDAILADWHRAEIRRPFDLAKAPLFRVVVHLISDGEFQFWWSFHHAIMDGWSLHAAVAEVFTAYSALRNGQDPGISAPKTRYRKHIALELEALDSPEQRKFWTDQLRGAEPALLATPAGRHGGSTVDVSWHDIDPTVATDLAALAERLGMPVRTVLLAAHVRVCAALLGRHDVTTGVIGNGRPETRDADQVKGLFLNTYPLRMPLSATTWAGLAADVFERELAILPHRRYPLAAIVEQTGWSPFDIVFDFRRFRSYEALAAHDDLRFDLGAYYEHTNFPLTAGFVLSPDGSALRLQLRYDTGRFDAATIATVGRAYLSTLARMAAHPDAPVLAAGALDAPDVAEVARIAAGPPAEIDGPGIYQRVERAAATTRNTAVRATDGELTYAELLDLAGRVAGHLADAGVRRGDPVGVCLGRGRLLLPVLLGVMRLGANYVPLDPAYPIDRLRYIAGHCGAAFVVHDRESAAVAAELGLPALAAEEAAAHPTLAPAVAVTGDDLAYTIYTSGSTGLPKGVQVRHASVVNLLDSLISVLDVDADHTYLATTSISFDIHANEMFVPLILGATVVVADRAQVTDGEALRSLIEAEPDLVGQGPPAMWRMLLDAGWRPFGMAAVLCGGEAFPRELAGRLIADEVPVWNMYGPTETTVWSAVHRVDHVEGPVPIGHPLHNTTMYVLDEHLHPALPGVPGELYLGGDGLAHGYHGRPDLTADRFVPDPFAAPAQAGARLYRTGDLVRLTDDGTFEFLERVDLQVKVRGYRIELEEVEARLGAHPDVAAAVVAAPTGTDGERVLVGYVVAVAPGFDTSVLRDWCLATLPAYMVPTAWVVLDALPRTPNGKVDRKALPDLDRTGARQPGDATAPGTETERAVAAIWSDTLGVTSVGVNASFFDLGGHSLRALRVILKIRDELGVNLPVAALIQASTVRRLAALIDEQRGKGPASQNRGRRLVVPLNDEGHPRVFVFHPLGGHIFGYAPLAGLLSSRISVYGVRANGMEPGETPTDSIASLVERYLKELRAVQPAGPYRIAGWCMGATLALETARRLRADGEQVAFLGLVVANPFDPAPVALLADPTDLVLHAMGQGVEVSYAELATVDGVANQIDYVFTSGESAGMLREDVSSRDDALRLLRVYQANATAISAHEAEAYDGEAHVFVLPEELPDPPDMGWSEIVVGRVHLHELPGRADNFLDPEWVGRLAEIIADRSGL